MASSAWCVTTCVKIRSVVICSSSPTEVKQTQSAALGWQRLVDLRQAPGAPGAGTLPLARLNDSRTQRRNEAGRTGNAPQWTRLGASARTQELVSASACRVRNNLKHFFAFACGICSHLLAFPLIIELPSMAVPHLQVENATLRRELQWAHLKIESLTEQLRQQRIKFLGPRSETLSSLERLCSRRFLFHDSHREESDADDFGTGVAGDGLHGGSDSPRRHLDQSFTFELCNADSTNSARSQTVHRPSPVRDLAAANPMLRIGLNI